MMKKSLCFGLAAAAAVLLLTSGSAQVTSRGQEPGTRPARLADPEARTAAVIPGPPAGWTTPGQHLAPGRRQQLPEPGRG